MSGSIASAAQTTVSVPIVDPLGLLTVDAALAGPTVRSLLVGPTFRSGVNSRSGVDIDRGASRFSVIHATATPARAWPIGLGIGPIIIADSAHVRTERRKCRYQ